MGGQFIPYPSTWLNQARWEDESISKPVETEEDKIQRKIKELEEATKNEPS